jgi:hypothetical protein
MHLKEYGVDSRESEHGLAAGCCEHGTEESDDTAGEEFREQLRDSRMVPRDGLCSAAKPNNVI